MDATVAALAKMISDAKHPAPCMPASACEALALHLVRCMTPGPVRERYLTMTPDQLRIRDL